MRGGGWSATPGGAVGSLCSETYSGVGAVVRLVRPDAFLVAVRWY